MQTGWSFGRVIKQVSESRERSSKAYAASGGLSLRSFFERFIERRQAGAGERAGPTQGRHRCLCLRACDVRGDGCSSSLRIQSSFLRLQQRPGARGREGLEEEEEEEEDVCAHEVAISDFCAGRRSLLERPRRGSSHGAIFHRVASRADVPHFGIPH